MSSDLAREWTNSLVFWRSDRRASNSACFVTEETDFEEWKEVDEALSPSAEEILKKGERIFFCFRFFFDIKYIFFLK